jgi:hypothetical protein
MCAPAARNGSMPDWFNHEATKDTKKNSGSSLDRLPEGYPVMSHFQLRLTEYSSQSSWGPFGLAG